MTPERRLLRAALAVNAASLFLISGIVGGWVERFSRGVLPPLTSHVLVHDARGAAQARLSPTDLDEIRRIPGVVRIHARSARADSISVLLPGGQSTVEATVYTADTDWPFLAGFAVSEGAKWTAADRASGAPVAVLSGAWPENPEFVTLRGRVLRVRGILDGPDAFQRDGRGLWVADRAGGSEGAITYLIEVDGKDSRDLAVAARVDKLVRARFGTTAIGESPIRVVTFRGARERVALLRRGVFLFVLAFCALPAALVGAGVSAVTRLAIRRRIPEIGLRRAVGASRQQVLDQFVGEALALSRGATWRAAALAGVALGIGRLFGLQFAPPPAMIVASFALPSVVCFAFAVPAAVEAANIPPIAALGSR